MPKPGRNDPCPCGSGKKYKHCCLAALNAPEAPEDLAWARLRRLLDEHRADMLRFIASVYGRGAIEEAWGEFVLDDEAELDPDSIHIPVFMPWLFHFWSPDPADTEVREAALHEVIPTAEYLRRKKSLHPMLREYLQSCLSAPLSVLEIVAVDPGRGMRLHDLFTGEEHEVQERSASVAMETGDIVFGQVAAGGGVSLLEVCQSFAIPPIWKLEVIDFRQRQFEGAEVPRERLRDFDIELLELYLRIAERLFERTLPELQNTDGEPLSMRKVVFEVSSAQEAFDALKHLALEESEDELLKDAMHEPGGRLTSVRFSWLKSGNSRHRGLENTVLGSVSIEDRRLVAEVNSEERENALRRIVAEALGDRARHLATEIQSMEKLLAEAPASRRSSKESAELAELPEVKAKIAEMMANHYEHWVDEKLPALGGRTPLEALADPAGREAVETLVRQIERDGERMRPLLDPAIARRLRERLGLN